MFGNLEEMLYICRQKPDKHRRTYFYTGRNLTNTGEPIFTQAETNKKTREGL